MPSIPAGMAKGARVEIATFLVDTNWIIASKAGTHASRGYRLSPVKRGNGAISSGTVDLSIRILEANACRGPASWYSWVPIRSFG